MNTREGGALHTAKPEYVVMMTSAAPSSQEKYKPHEDGQI